MYTFLSLESIFQPYYILTFFSWRLSVIFLTSLMSPCPVIFLLFIPFLCHISESIFLLSELFCVFVLCLFIPRLFCVYALCFFSLLPQLDSIPYLFVSFLIPYVAICPSIIILMSLQYFFSLYSFQPLFPKFFLSFRTSSLSSLRNVFFSSLKFLLWYSCVDFHYWFFVICYCSILGSSLNFLHYQDLLPGKSFHVHDIVCRSGWSSRKFAIKRNLQQVHRGQAVARYKFGETDLRYH